MKLRRQALPRPSQVRRELLQQPQVAIGVAEFGVLHTLEIRNLADFNSALDERLPRLLDVRDDEMQTLSDLSCISVIFCLPRHSCASRPVGVVTLCH